MADLNAAQQLHELTYEGQDLLDLSINLEMLEQRCPLAQPSYIAGSKTASFQPLGQLDILPLEIIQNILELLDLHTLTLVQSLSHRSNLLVHNLPQHRELVTHAPNALRAMLSPGLAPHFTIKHLSRALRTQDCFKCGSFGAYLYLLECRRSCWLCLAKSYDTVPLPKDFAMNSLKRQLPCMQSLPGRYSLDCTDGNTHIRRAALISFNSAKEAGIKIHGRQEGTAEYFARQEGMRAAKYFARRTHNSLVAGKRNFLLLQARTRAQYPSPFHLSQSFRAWEYMAQQFMAAIRFPTLDPSNGTIEWGLSCKGCRDGRLNDVETKDWEAMYTKRGYLAHFEQCKWSKLLLASLETRDLTMSESN